MEINEKLRNLRKKAGLSQELLAAKIFVSRTLITKYESGSAFPTDDNLAKIAAVLGVKVEDILSEDEKSEIVYKSFLNLNRFWSGLAISIIIISAILLVFSLIPFYKYGHYVYPIPDGQLQPDFIHGYVSIVSATLRHGNPIAIITIIFFICTIISASLTFTNFNKQTRRIFRLLSLSLFLVALILFIISFATMVSLVNTLGFQLNYINRG